MLYEWGVYLFAAGSLVLTYDAVRTRNRHALLGCLLFDAGCACFAVDAHLLSLRNQSSA